MDASRFDRIAKAAATGVSRRQILRGVLATAVGGTLIHLSGDESAAGKRQCCRRLKRVDKQTCVTETAGECPKLIDWSCVKTGPDTCKSTEFACASKDGRLCIT